MRWLGNMLLTRAFKNDHKALIIRPEKGERVDTLLELQDQQGVAKFAVDSNGSVRTDFNAEVERAPARRLRIETYRNVDVNGESIDLCHVSNGVLGFEFQYGYASPWANCHNYVTIYGIRVMGCGADYLYSDGVQAGGPFAGSIYGSGFWTAMTGLKFFNSAGTEIDPDGLDPTDTSFSVEFTRWIGASVGATTNGPQFTLTANKTPMIYLADKDAAEIYRNDKNTYGEALVLASAGVNRGLIGKVIDVGEVRSHDVAQNEKYRIYFWVQTVTGTGGTLTVRIHPAARLNTVGGYHFANYASLNFTAGGGGAWAAGAWNYVEVSAEHFRPGTNMVVFDGGGMTTQNNLTIGVDTTVVTSMRNKAYQLYNAAGAYWKMITHKYTFYRDMDKIDMAPSIHGSDAQNGYAGVGKCCPTYNFGMLHNFYRWPTHENFGERLRQTGYKWYSPNRVTYNGVDIIPGTTIPWTDTGGGWLAGGNTVLRMEPPAYDPYDAAGIKFWRSDDLRKSGVITVTKGASTEDLSVVLEKFVDRPYWWGVGDVPADAAQFNDIVLYLGRVSGGVYARKNDYLNTDVLPVVTLDLSSMVRYFK